MGILDVADEVRRFRADHQWIHPLLMKHLHTRRTRKLPGPRDWIAASRAPLWCGRFHVMAYRMGMKVVDDDLGPQDHWRMGRGTAMHSVFQEGWFGPAGWLKGGWKCPKCGHIHGMGEGKEVTVKSSVFLPSKCDECSVKPGRWNQFTFVEPYVRDNVSLVRGRTDGVLKLPGHKEELFDLKIVTDLSRIKSKGARDFDVRQLHWYLGPSGMRLGRMVYVNPGAKKLEEAIVEVQIDFDPMILWEEREKIRVIREAIQESARPLPSCPHDRALPWGKCPCVELEAFWRSHGGGSSP